MDGGVGGAKKQLITAMLGHAEGQRKGVLEPFGSVKCVVLLQFKRIWRKVSVLRTNWLNI